ncbi:MAG: SH3 domain-containing protein [Propylenella sp.]
MKHLATTLAGMFLLATVQQAVAQPGYTTGGVNCRSGPGTNYYVVYTLPAYTAIDIGACDYGWCYIAYNYQNCYVSLSYLAYGTYSGGGYRPSYRPNYGGGGGYKPSY